MGDASIKSRHCNAEIPNHLGKKRKRAAHQMYWERDNGWQLQVR